MSSARPSAAAPRVPVAVMGAGAVGGYYGGMLARAGHPVTMIGRPAHVEALRRDGLRFDGLSFREQVPVAAATEASAARGARLVLFCVKSTDTVEAARALAPHLSADALLLSLQNGVDNVERMRPLLPCPVAPAVVYVAAEMAGPGHLRHTGRGELVIGSEDAALAARLADTAALLVESGIPTTVSDNIAGELWAKLLLNCAYNAISALGRARYRRMVDHAPARAVMVEAVREVLAVARAAEVALPEGDHVQITLDLADTMGGAQSSTAQDIQRGRATEIDHLNGYIARRGAELGVPVPVNRTLHALVKLLEAAPG